MAGLIETPRIVVFDFNGTLFDDFEVAYGSVREIFKTYGIPCPTSWQCRQEISADYMEFYHKHGIPRTAIGDDLNVIRNEFYKINGGNAKMRPDVWITLCQLTFFQIRTAIVSAESQANLYRQLIFGGNLQRSFDLIKAESWGIQGKKDALLQVADIFGEEPNKIIYVDDSVDGLTSAKNVGVVPVAFTNRTAYHSRSRLLEVAEFEVKEIGEIVNLVRNGGRLS